MEIRQTVVIVDLSGRCNQLIARSVRNLNVYCRLVGDNANLADIQKSNPIGIILTGESEEKKAIETEVASLGVPVLDIRNIDVESKQGAKTLKKFCPTISNINFPLRILFKYILFSILLLGVL